jgi:hypothetical protein
VTDEKRSRVPAVVAIPVLAIAALVTVASVVQAIHQDSWGPIWAIGWLPAVLIATLGARAHYRPCPPRARCLVGR